MAVDLELVKKIREATGAGMMDVKKALDEASGDEKKALAVLKKQGHEKVAKRADRPTGQGLVEAYVHMGKIGSMVEVNCETDFVAKNPEFKELAHEAALLAASYEGNSLDELLELPTLADPSETLSDLLKTKIAKFGENIKITRFTRYVLGQPQTGSN